MEQLSILLNKQKSIKVNRGVRLHKLLESEKDTDGLPYIAAIVNNNCASLSYPLSFNAKIDFITMRNPHGWRIYRRSLSFLLAKAVHDLYPEAEFRVEHSFGLGLYCTINNISQKIDEQLISNIELHMHHLVKKSIPITRIKFSYEDAVKALENHQYYDKLRLLDHRNPPAIVAHECDGFYDVAHGPLAYNTGMLDKFKLIHYEPGFVLHLPDKDDPLNIRPFEDQPHLFNIFKEYKKWGHILKIDNVGSLNEKIKKGQIGEFIRINEALHEKKIANIADTICNLDNVKVVLIAGPSSSGKTTFAKRLALQIMANGKIPLTISTDDYFVGIERNPVDENGNPDFEHIEAVDLELFNKNMLRLIAGEEILVPKYNFEKKQQEFPGNKMRLENDQILIVEGIHGLNPRLTEMIDSKNKFKIYVSALTQLNLDRTNRISTTDNRLMRRMVRDYNFRGHSALYTLQLWPSVRRGEKRWIFPFQREADATFNTALDYELSVLKRFVEPLLTQVKTTHPEYAEARRLSEFLINFLPTPPDDVPATSILREYLGNSAFKY